MRYLLALLLMIAVGGEAVAQLMPNVSFEESESMVTEDDGTVEISLVHDGGQSAGQFDVDVRILSHVGHWPFVAGEGRTGHDFTVTFAAGKDKTTLSIELRDDEVAQSQRQEFTLDILDNRLAVFNLGAPNRHMLVWDDDETLALPAVSFETATSEAEEGSDLVGGVTPEEKNIHLTLDKPAEDDLYVNVEIEKATVTTHWPFLLFDDEEMGEAEKTVYFESGESKATLDLSFADDNAPRPPQKFTLKIIEEASSPFSYQIGTISTNTLTVNDDDSIVLNVTPSETGFKVQPNRESVEGYTVRWAAEGPGIAAEQTIKTGMINWPVDNLDTTNNEGLEHVSVTFDFDCAKGDALIAITEPVVTGSSVPASYVIPLDGSVGGLPKANLCGDTASSHSPPSGGDSPGDGTPSSGGSPGGGSPGGGSPGGGSPGGGSPGGDDPMDPPISDGDDPMNPEAASDSDGGCSLSGGSGLNQLASNAVAMGLVLMFGLCLVLRGGRRNVSDSLR